MASEVYRRNSKQVGKLVMERQALITRLLNYEADEVAQIGHALVILRENDSVDVSNDEVGQVWERVSKAIDIKFSDYEDHDAWKLEAELSAAYRYE